MICNKKNCRSNKNGYHNNCVALRDGAESENCPFFKTREQFNRETEELIINGHVICKNQVDYEKFLDEEH